MTNYPNDVTHYRVRTALRWAISAFGRHAVALLIPTVVFVVVLVWLGSSLTELVTQITPAPQVSPKGTDAAGRMAAYLSSTRNLATMLEGMVLFVVLSIMQSAYLGGMLDLAAGRPVTPVSFMKPRDVGNVFLAGLIIAVPKVLVSAYWNVGGQLVVIFTLFSIVALLDRGLSPADAVRASVALVRANFWRLVLALLVVWAILVVGILALGVGVLAAVPVASLFLVHTYHQLTGSDVAPV